MRSALRRPSSFARLLMLPSLIAAPVLSQGATYVVTSGGDVGLGTLRQAILAANLTIGTADRIEFAAGVTTVTVLLDLPAITDRLEIDGTVNATRVRLERGVLSGTGLRFSTGSDGSAVYGMEVANFVDGIVVESNNVTVGSSAAGNVLLGAFNGTGIQVSGSGVVLDGNTVREFGTFGITLSGTGATVRGNSVLENGGDGIRIFSGAGGVLRANLVSGNGGNGIYCDASGFEFYGNTVGLESDGITPLGNARAGLALGTTATGALVGSSTSGDGNIFSGNGTYGLLLTADGTSVLGNKVGTDSTGTTSVPNGAGGILISGASVVIGGSGLGLNVVSGNSGPGIELQAQGTVQGNYVGVAANGISALGNRGAGILVSGAGSRIGGSGALGNIVGSNRDEGIRIEEAANVLVLGNSVGLAADLSTNVGNGAEGVRISRNCDNFLMDANRVLHNGAQGIHMTGPSPNAQILDTLVSGNQGDGIVFSGPDGLIDFNRVGVNLFGNAVLANRGNGVVAQADATNLSVTFNTISGNDGSGVVLSGAGAYVVANRIGVNASGLLDFGNGVNGVDVKGDSVILGTSGFSNTISGNGGVGVRVEDADGVILEANLVGLATDLVTVLANDSGGVLSLGASDSLWLNANRIVGNGGDGVAVLDAPFAPTVEFNLVSGNSGHGILVSGASASIQGNRVGVDLLGNTPAGNAGDGIRLDATATAARVISNVSSANSGDGIAVFAPDVEVMGNSVGVNVAGTLDLGNAGDGIDISGAGALVGSSTPGDRNIVAGNAGVGIRAGRLSVVRGNLVGLGSNGLTVIANGNDGVLVAGNGALIGGPNPGEENWITGNGAAGVEVGAFSDVVVEENRIGEDTAGTVVGNTGKGIHARGGANNLVLRRNAVFGSGEEGIQVDQPSANVTVDGNRVGGSGAVGIYVLNSGTLVQFNVSGLDADSSLSLANASHGFETGPSANGVILRENVASGNTERGMYLRGGSVVVEGNIVGLAPDALTVRANTWEGIYVVGAGGRIGGNSGLQRNVISGNGTGSHSGLYVAGNATIVQGNTIGLAGDGVTPRGNAEHGILVNAPGAVIGGAGAGNVIAANAEHGILLLGSSARVEGNLIGFDSTGTRPLGNGLTGIEARGAAGFAIIGGATTNEGNRIGNNGDAGLRVTTSNVEVRNNIIGLDAAEDPAPNAGAGVELTATSSEVRLQENVIASNTGSGVVSRGSSNSLLSNWIGTDPTGVLQRGNGVHGVLLDGAVDSTLGTALPIAGNLIAFNARAGVAVEGGSAISNQIIANALRDNGSLGIAQQGLTVRSNDALDADSGPNGLGNLPELAGIRPGDLEVSGTLAGLPSEAYRFHLYTSSACDPSGYGEGENYVGEALATSDAAGLTTFTFTLLTPAVAGEIFTVTATDSIGSTSGFSRCRAVEGDPYPRVTDIVRAAGEPDAVSTAPVRFEVVFDEPVADFTAADFQPVDVPGHAGAAATAVASPFGQAADLDGSGGFTVPAAALPSLAGASFTIEFWERRDALQSGPGYLVQWGTTGTNSALTIGYNADHTMRFGFGGNELDTLESWQQTGVWQHWTFSFDATSQERRVFRNGVLLLEELSTSSFLGSGADLTLGLHSAGGFEGQVDSFRLWTIPFTSEAQVLASIAAPTLSDSNIAVELRFDALQDLAVGAPGANDVEDSSGQGAHADASGSAALTPSGVFSERLFVTVLPGAGNGEVGLSVPVGATLRDITALLVPPAAFGEQFIIIQTPPFVFTDVADFTQAEPPIEGFYTVSHISATTDVLYILPPNGTWQPAGVVTGGTFSYVPTWSDGRSDGPYRFAVVASDIAGNVSTLPTGTAGAEVLYNNINNSDYPTTTTLTGIHLAPMTDDVDILLALDNVLTTTTVVVRRTFGDIAPTGHDPVRLIDEQLVMAGPFRGATVSVAWPIEDSSDDTLTAPLNAVFADFGTPPILFVPGSLRGGYISLGPISGLGDPLQPVSVTYYPGNNTATVPDWMAFEE